MRLLTSAVLALWLCACPDPRGDGCLESIADQKVLRAPLGDRGVQGQPLTRTIEAPLTNCGAIPTVKVELNAPGNRVATPDQISSVSMTGQIASVVVTFTPDAPGTWRISALFPGLGSRTVDVEVIRTRTDEPLPFEFPASVSCPQGPWPFEGSAYAACEQPDASIAWFPLDGGAVNVIPGRDLVVVQNVWWLLNVAGDTLERYEWDGGLTRTNEWTNFTWTAIRGVHTTTTAVRPSAGFTVRVVDIDGSDNAFAIGGSFTFENGIFFVERDADDAGVLMVLPSAFENDWVGIEPHVVWTHVDAQVAPTPAPSNPRHPLRPASRPLRPS